MPQLDELLRHLKDEGGSDLHLAAGLQPRIRVSGGLRAIDGWGALSDEKLRELLEPLTSESQWSSYEQCNDLDFAYGLKGVARFRANYFAQEHGAGAVFRVIPEKIITVEELGLSEAIAALATLEKGLVVVTGPTGSGKSTTLAAVVDKINRDTKKHIVTVEDPVEFVHKGQQSVLSHREVGVHTGSFAKALRAVIRQDADVVLVGEMRDRETIAAAVAAAEMGMLVFGTLHTNGAAKTIDRIVDAFPASEQPQIRLSLSESLAAIVSQLLVKKVGGGRVAANEILLRTQGLPNVIRESNTQMINSIIQSGRAQGMIAMDDALAAHLEAGVITAEDAHAKANDKARFEAQLTPDA